MKKLFHNMIICSILIPLTQTFAVAGFGVQGGQSLLTAKASTSFSEGATLNTSEFSNPLSGGAYLYIDAIPFIDLEADFTLSLKEYTFDFTNILGSSGPYDFGWADFSVYLTARKEIVGLGIPLLAKAKLFYGGGYNMHTVTPMMDLDLMKSALAGDLAADPTNLSENDLVDFLKDSQAKHSGFHIQSGLQFKILVLDTFLFYRHTFSKDVVPDQNHFGGLNLRIGYGF